MYFFLQVALSGIATGAIYGLIAVGYSLTFLTTRILNFALGMWVMLGGMLTLSLVVHLGINPIISLVVILTAMTLLGIVAERISVFPFLRAGSDVWIMSTLAVGFLLIDFAEIIWGRTPSKVPGFLSNQPIRLGPMAILPQQVVVLIIAAIVFAALDLFFRRTLLGKAFRAVAHSGQVSTLMGINVRRIQAGSFAAACALAGVAGFMVVPLTLAEPQMGTVLGLKAFAIAIIAGLAPNGAGKTTLINILSGLYRADCGEIAMDGAVLHLQSLSDAALAGIARTFQTIKLFGDLAVLDHVMVGFARHSPVGILGTLVGGSHRRWEAERHAANARQLIQFVGLDLLENAPASGLAYGHRRLVEIARALAVRPKVLLLDEPAAGLVAQEIEALADVIRRLRDCGVTILLVEHHMDLIVSVSDRITVLDYGEVIAEGSPAAIQKDPRVVTAYLGKSLAAA